MPAYPCEANSVSESSFELKPNTLGEDKLPPDRRSRRESLLNNLPQIEANLLPSLRDTIVRMTKSPAQTESSHLSIPRPRSSRSLSPAYASREHPTPKSVTPEPSTRGSVDILTPRTNLPAKPPPRSTLRPPAPSIYSQPLVHSPPRSILKSIPKRGGTPSPIPDGGASRRATLSTGSKPAVPLRRSRSRTDPGTIPPVVSFADQYPAPDSQPMPRLQPSGIPRPQPRRTGTGTYWSTDESDADNCYEHRGRDHHQPVIPRVNANLQSENEPERRKGSHGGIGSRSGNKTVGLGLALDSEKKKLKSGASQQLPSRIETPQRSARRTTDRTPAALEGHSDHHQRREALLDIVSRLNLDDNAGGLESDYNGEDGVAISISPDLETQVNLDDEQEHREGDAMPSSSSYAHKNRPRSASHTPTLTFLLSPHPDDQHSTPQPRTTTPHNKRHLGPPPTPNAKAQAHSHRESSRSPVVPQIDTNAIPAALRRYSVYHRTASPTVPTPTASNTNNGEDKRTSASDRRNSGTGASVPKAQRGSSQQRREGAVGVNAIVNIEVEARPYAAAAAARERKAYGIPSSDSLGVYQDGDEQPLLTHAESDLSSVGSVYWGDDSDSELSPAAETLFRKLGQGRKGYQPSSEKVPRSSFASRASSPSPPKETPEIRWQAQSASPRRDESRPRSRLASPPPVPMGPSSDYAVADTESRRQDLIAEIHQVEESFVKRLQVFVQLFILPLRVQDNKEWIAGVPTEVARLFDWLEDIVVLHTQILASLESTREAQYPTVDRIADSIRAFIPRLEVYQPYLVNLEDAITLVEQLIQDDDSDFGEFVRLQEAATECDRWNFQSFLIEPINLLAKFPTLFSKLLDMTPKNHRDYLPTLALVRSTEMVIRVMTEVKLREDEYDTVQEYLACIQGLSSSARIATRERRLLHQGVLHLVDVEANDSSVAAGTSRLFRYFPPDANTTAADRTGKFAPVIHRWEAIGRGRSGSTSSSSSTGVSLSSLKASSSTASSIFFSSFKLTLPQGRLKPSTAKRPASPSPAPRANNSNIFCVSSRGTSVQVFIFTDLLLLAALGSNSESGDGWTLLNHIGTTRILNVQQLQEGEPHDLSTGSGGTTVITLEVLSVNAHKLNHTPNYDSDDSSVFLLRLEIPPTRNDVEESNDDPNGSKRQWETALRRCQQFTLCSLSTPSRNHDPQLDTAYEKHQAVFSLLASGLPLPKSPSAQIADIYSGATDDTTTQEREERGWWSLRFQQVFRELQRQDMGSAALTGP
ncbi:hypothetical protein C0991_009344 [Blastosporella zonata]|nr:hypothetical protein C0991_009344 [Blastosporella zonata]